MRVALVSFARRGGMVHFGTQLANSLQQITPVATVDVDDVASRQYSGGVQRFSIHAGDGPVGSLLQAGNPFTWLRLLRVLRKIKPDVVHVVAPHEWNPVLIPIIKVLGRPLIYTVHDPVPHRGAPLRMRISHMLITRAADALVVLTRYGRAQLQAQGYDTRKIFMIPMGVFTALTKTTGYRRSTEDLILFFGRLEPYKGLEILLSAFSRLRDALPDWKLVVAGTGTLPDVVDRSGSSSIQILNRYVSDEEVARIMLRARIVVLPYLEATQSAVIATAYAFGRPVIVTRTGGLPEMVIQRKTGLVVPPNDVEALARAIKNLASDPRRLKRMGHCAYSVSRARWSWERIAQIHLAMYDAVVNRRSPQ